MGISRGSREEQEEQFQDKNGELQSVKTPKNRFQKFFDKKIESDLDFS